MKVYAVLDPVHPGLQRFPVRATIPAPDTAVFPDGWALRDPGSGRLFWAQLEPVWHGPLGELVSVEVVAVVEGVEAGDDGRVRLELVQELGESVGGASGTVALLATDTERFRLRVVAPDGSPWEAMLGVPKVHLVLAGPLQETGPVRFSVHWNSIATLGESSVGSAIAVPAGKVLHAGGVQSVMRAWAGLEVLELAFEWHNGFCEAPLGPLHFRSLELLLPPGWEATPFLPYGMAGLRWEDPDTGAVRQELIKPLPVGQVHVLLPQRALERRYLIHRATAEGRDLAARLVASGMGWCRARPAGVVEHTWSHANPLLGALLPQRYPVPVVDAETAADEVRGRWSSLYAALAGGAKLDPSYSATGALGPYHPSWGFQGGTTGGDEIECWPGVLELAAGVPEGFLTMLARARSSLDRQPGYLVELDGRPLDVDARAGAADKLPWNFELGPDGKQPLWLNGEDPFGWTTAPAPWGWLLQEQKLACPYQQQLDDFGPIDHQHLVRRSGALGWLVGAAHDPLAKLQLRQLAAQVRASFWEGEGDRYHATVGWAWRHAAKHPDLGIHVGRAEAHNAQVVVLAYASLPVAERGHLERWLRRSAEAWCAGAMANGYVQRNEEGKPWLDLGKQWAAAQPYEAVLLAHAALGIHDAYAAGRDPVLTASLRAFILGAVIAQVYAWPDGAPEPVLTVAVAELSKPGGPPNPATFTKPPGPPAGGTKGSDGYYLPSLLAYAMRLTVGNPKVLGALLELAQRWGNGDFVGKLEKAPLQQLGMRAPLLAAAQWLEAHGGLEEPEDAA